MKDLDEHKKIAVLIDADNAQHSKMKSILDEISTHGHIVTKRAYGDWSSDYLKNWRMPENTVSVCRPERFGLLLPTGSPHHADVLLANPRYFENPLLNGPKHL